MDVGSTIRNGGMYGGFLAGSMAAVVAMLLDHLGNKEWSGRWFGRTFCYLGTDLEASSSRDCSGCLVLARVSYQVKALRVGADADDISGCRYLLEDVIVVLLSVPESLRENPCPPRARRWRCSHSPLEGVVMEVRHPRSCHDVLIWLSRASFSAT